MEQEITKETKERVFAKVKSPFVVFVSFCSNSVAPIESFFALLSLSLLLGCGDGKSSASGTVTFDGQPVASGTITFVKSDGELVREGAIIKDGAFQAHVPPGNYKIELNAQKVVSTRKQKGFDGKDEEVELTEELFPEQYNTKTTLTTTIDRGPNRVKLDVKTN